MTPMTPDVHAICAYLTKAQREVILRGAFPAWVRELRETRVKSALVKRGLARFEHVIAGRGDFFLTEAGEQCRAYLKEQQP